MPAKEAKHKTASMKYFLRFDQFWDFVRWHSPPDKNLLLDSIEEVGFAGRTNGSLGSLLGCGIRTIAPCVLLCVVLSSWASITAKWAPFGEDSISIVVALLSLSEERKISISTQFRSSNGCIGNTS